MNGSPSRVSATGCWTFLIGPEFKLIDNGDSVQAAHGPRIVYVSSLLVGTPAHSVLASHIRATAAKRLGSGDRLSHVGASVQGDAEVVVHDGARRLQGIMCADGTIATCAIAFVDASDREWAISVWKSLLCDEAVS